MCSSLEPIVVLRNLNLDDVSMNVTPTGRLFVTSPSITTGELSGDIQNSFAHSPYGATQFKGAHRYSIDLEISCEIMESKIKTFDDMLLQFGKDNGWEDLEFIPLWKPVCDSRPRASLRGKVDPYSANICVVKSIDSVSKKIKMTQGTIKDISPHCGLIITGKINSWKMTDRYGSFFLATDIIVDPNPNRKDDFDF